MFFVSIKLIVLGMFLKIFDIQNCKLKSGSDRNLNIMESQVLQLEMCINFIKKIRNLKKNLSLKFHFFHCFWVYQSFMDLKKDGDIIHAFY